MRTEHPRPDFYRDNWQNLNGSWEFYNDLSSSGKERRIYADDFLIKRSNNKRALLSGEQTFANLLHRFYADGMVCEKYRIKRGTA